MAKLLVKDVQQKTTKSGKPYLAVKSSSDKFYTIWQEYQYIWHLFTPGAELEVAIATNGKFASITGVVGIAEPSGGTVVAKQGMPSAWDKAFERFDRIEKKLDWLIEERKTLGTLPPLDTKDDTKPETIPF